MVANCKNGGQFPTKWAALLGRHSEVRMVSLLHRNSGLQWQNRSFMKHSVGPEDGEVEVDRNLRWWRCPLHAR